MEKTLLLRTTLSILFIGASIICDEDSVLVRDGFLIQKIEDSVMYRAVGRHQLTLKHLFLSESEVVSLKGNLTVIKQNIDEISDPLIILQRTVLKT